MGEMKFRGMGGRDQVKLGNERRETPILYVKIFGLPLVAFGDPDNK